MSWIVVVPPPATSAGAIAKCLESCLSDRWSGGGAGCRRMGYCKPKERPVQATVEEKAVQATQHGGMDRRTKLEAVFYATVRKRCLFFFGGEGPCERC